MSNAAARASAPRGAAAAADPESDRATTVPEAPDAPERAVAADLVRHGAVAAPVALAIAGIGWGWAGVASAGLAIALVLANFWVSARLIAWAAAVSETLLMGVTLGGFLVRMGIIAGVILTVGGQAWIAPWPLGITLIVGHLGLLAAEVRSVSASLAFPGLKPRPGLQPRPGKE